jgi:cell division septum initiation protein DivIVA
MMETEERIQFQQKINELQVEVGALKEKVSFFSVIYDKFDNTLEKFEKMMEERRNDTNDDLRDVYKKISDTEDKIMAEIYALRQDMKRQHEIEARKIQDLDKWRWLVVGGSVVIGWLVSKVVAFLTYAK